MPTGVGLNKQEIELFWLVMVTMLIAGALII
jgi:hypothetical protein